MRSILVIVAWCLSCSFSVGEHVPAEKLSDLRPLERWIKKVHGDDFFYILKQNGYWGGGSVVIYCFKEGSTYQYIGAFRESNDETVEWSSFLMRELSGAAKVQVELQKQLSRILDALAAHSSARTDIDSDSIILRGPKVKKSFQVDPDSSKSKNVLALIHSFQNSENLMK